MSHKYPRELIRKKIDKRIIKVAMSKLGFQENTRSYTENNLSSYSRLAWKCRKLKKVKENESLVVSK